MSANEEGGRDADEVLGPLVERCVAIAREWEAAGWEPHTADAHELAPDECAAYAAAKDEEEAAVRVWDTAIERTNSAAWTLQTMKARPTPDGDAVARMTAELGDAVRDEFAALAAYETTRRAVYDAAVRQFAAMKAAYDVKRWATNRIVRRLKEQRVALTRLYPAELGSGLVHLHWQETASLGRKVDL